LRGGKGDKMVLGLSRREEGKDAGRGRESKGVERPGRGISLLIPRWREASRDL